MLTSRPLKLDKWRTKLFFLPHTCTIDFYFELRMGVRDTVIIFLEHGPCKRSVYVSPPSPLLKSLTFNFYCIFLLLLYSFRRFSSSKILMGISIRKAWKSGRLAVVVGEGRRAWSLPLPLASFLPCFPPFLTIRTLVLRLHEFLFILVIQFHYGPLATTDPPLGVDGTSVSPPKCAAA